MGEVETMSDARMDAMQAQVDRIVEAAEQLNGGLLSEFGKLSLAFHVERLKQFKQYIKEEFERVDRLRAKQHEHISELDTKLHKLRDFCTDMNARLKHMENPNGLK